MPKLIYKGLEVGGVSNEAIQCHFDNTGSNIKSDNVEAALKELDSKTARLIQVTPEEYEALTPEEKASGLYIIIDDKLSVDGINPVQNKVIANVISTLNSNIFNYHRQIYKDGHCLNVPYDTWLKTTLDIVVDTSGEYIVFFPFLRSQGGESSIFNVFLYITENDTFDDDPHMAAIQKQWGITNLGGWCYRFNKGVKYHVFIKHNASATHTIDFRCFLYKLSE